MKCVLLYVKLSSPGLINIVVDMTICGFCDRFVENDITMVEALVEVLVTTRKVDFDHGHVHFQLKPETAVSMNVSKKQRDPCKWPCDD